MDARAPLIETVAVPGSALRTLATLSPAQYPVLFDSAADGPLARFSLLTAAPRAALWRDADGSLGASGITLTQGGFLDELEAWTRREHRERSTRGGLPFVDGWIVYLGYEVAAEIERRLKLPRAAAPLSAFALRVDTLAIHDVASDRVYAVSPAGEIEAQRRLIEDLQAAAEPGAAEEPRQLPLAKLEEEAPQFFIERVHAAKEHIAAGDIYQANLSRPWRLTLSDPADEAHVYTALRAANPAPFAASVRFRDMTILSSSPERLLAITGREISTRPIAGTRARLGSAEQDARETSELVAHPKERAEHVMLIDLERNDLGRVCEPGSVEVDEYMVTESYAHVHHIVSNVRGRLRADASAVAALRALFPGGTITGCPKVRCMQVIAALEGEGRGAYTGSLGWLGTDGDADFNILIRTLSVNGRHIELRAGAGIVADSVPERELEETRAKARGMLRAFEAPHG
ncbi:MAG: aminodeoxychorismate synthase component I [Pseudomonadota bacterium]